MKSKLIVLGLAVVLSLSYANDVLAAEGDDQKMPEGTIMDGAAMPEGQADATAPKAVEVGNKICPVSGDEIPAPGEKGDMGDEPVKYEYNGKIYNLCCKMCIKDFKKDPEKYSKIADDEVANEKAAQQEGDQADQESATK